MTERPDPPTDSGREAGDAPQEAGWQEAGWRGIGPGRVERRLVLDEPEAQLLFFDLLERIAHLAGFPADARIRGGEVRVRGDRTEPPGLDLVLRLDLDRSER